MNNLVVQLLLKTGNFSSDLKTARGQIQNFQQGCSTAGKSLDAFGKGLGINIGALTKFGTAVGIAAAAGKAFKDVMESAQTTSDNFYGAIEGCKGIIEEFKVSLATADFSGFIDGIWGIYDAAKNARNAMDQLTNTQMSFSFLNKFNSYEFQSALNKYRDKNSTPEQKEAARKEMERIKNDAMNMAENAVKVVEDAYKSVIVSKSGGNLNMNDVTLAGFKRVMSIDVSNDPKKARDYWEGQYKDYLGELKKYADKDKGRRELIGKYGDAIMAHTLLEKMSDKKLGETLEAASKIPDFLSAAQTFETQYIRATNPDVHTTTGGGGSKTVKDEIQLLKESYSWWDKIAREKKQLRDAQVYNSESWNSYNEQLEEALNKMEQINALTERAKTNAKYGTDMLTPITGPNLTGQVVNTKPSGLAEDIKKDYEGLSINELNEKIKAYKELAANVKGNSELLAFYNQQIATLGDRVKALEGVGIPEVKKETINTWDEFNNAMSATSTIVSNMSQTFKDGTKLTTSSVLSMVSTVLPAIGTLISAIDALTVTEAVEAGVGAVEKAVSSSKHWIEAIAAVAALGSVVAAAIAAAQKPKGKKYASGGIVGGNSFYGDRVVANVNSGEMILNRSQQARLFQMANSGGMGGQVEFHISGTDLVGVLNNQTRKNKLIR